MLERIEKHLAIAFQQRIYQVKTGNVRRRIQPVVQASAAGQDLPMAVKQHDHPETEPECWRRNPGDRHQAHKVVEPAITPDCG